MLRDEEVRTDRKAAITQARLMPSEGWGWKRDAGHMID